MPVLRFNTLLTIIGSLFWYLAAGTLLYLLIAPVKVETPLTRQSDQTVQKTAAAEQKELLPSLATFGTVWHLPLQHPVFDPPPPPPPEIVKLTPPKLNAQLLATAVDGGEPTAMLRLPSGSFVTLKAGETFDNAPGNAKILNIDGTQVTLQFEGFEESLVIGVGK